MKSPIQQFCVAAALTLIWTLVASATPLASYEYDPGNLNPNTQGWTWSAKGTLNDNPTDAALNVAQTDGNAPYFTQVLGAANVTDPTGWTLTARLRLNSVSPVLTTGARYGVVLAIDTGPSGAWWNASFFKDGTTNDGVWSGFAPTQLAAIDMSVFHTFQLINNDGLITTPPKLYIDGIDTGMQAIDGGHWRSAGEVWWGSGNSGSLSNADWQFVTFELGQHPISAAHPGDFDSDGDVDGADFVAWQTHFPTSNNATLADGDADGDGDVDGADFVVWQTNFPFTPGPGISSVPEPPSLLLCVCVVSWLTFRGRCLRKSLPSDDDSIRAAT